MRRWLIDVPNLKLPGAVPGRMNELEVEWLDPYDVEGEDALDPMFLQTWRPNLKEKIDWIYGHHRPRVCLACGKPFTTFDLHEGIVSRQDIRGWTKERTLLIMNELNCIPLHHVCNTDNPPKREDVWESQKLFYPKAALYGWYTRLPWKAGVPRRFW